MNFGICEIRKLNDTSVMRNPVSHTSEGMGAVNVKYLTNLLR